MTRSVRPPPAYTLGGANAYTYDAVGNRTDLGGSYTTGNRITAFGSCTYGTDFDGNVTSKSGGCCAGAASLFWNAEGQLDSVHVTATGTGLRYLYDASGRLVLRRKNGTAEATFLWQGGNLLAELNGAATAKVAEYSYYPGLDNPHAVVLGSTRYYAHTDGLGNVVALTSEAKTLKSTYLYDDWGASAGVVDSNRARFKGALWLGPEIDIYFIGTGGTSRRAGGS
jgi:YD repeat-containing protein